MYSLQNSQEQNSMHVLAYWFVLTGTVRELLNTNNRRARFHSYTVGKIIYGLLSITGSFDNPGAASERSKLFEALVTEEFLTSRYESAILWILGQFVEDSASSNSWYLCLKTSAFQSEIAVSLEKESASPSSIHLTTKGNLASRLRLGTKSHVPTVFHATKRSLPLDPDSKGRQVGTL